MAEPDRGLLFVFQIIRIGCFRCDEGIECELRAEAEAGDEAVEGGFAVDGCPGIDVLKETFLFRTGDVFCSALKLIKEQEAVDDEFSKALQTVGNGHFVFGTENKYRRALLMVLKEAVNDVYDYIDWWLYEGAPDYEIWSADEEEKWELREPEALYEYITSQDSK